MKQVLKISHFFFIVLYSYVVNYLFLNDKERHYEYCISNIAKLNMLFIKIMQWIPCNEMDEKISSLIKVFSDNVPYDINDINHKQINDITSYFNKIDIEFTVDPIPVNAGTIAIVYSGTLNNKKIIIKQLRNGVKEQLKESIELLELLGEIFNYLPYFYMFKLKDAIQINKESLLLQSDFGVEIKNQELFRKKNKNFDKIIVPEIYQYDDVCFNNVIIMEKLEGKKISEIDLKHKHKYCESYNQLLINSILRQYIIHADLHIGNVIFLEEGKLGIIDFGYVLKFDKNFSDKIFKFYKFLFNKQIKKLTNYILTVLCSDINPNKTVPMDLNKIISNKIKLLFTDDNLFSGKRAMTLKDLIELNEYARCINKKVNVDFFVLALALGPSTTINAILKKDQPDNTLKNVFDEFIFKQVPASLKDY